MSKWTVLALVVAAFAAGALWTSTRAPKGQPAPGVTQEASSGATVPGRDTSSAPPTTEADLATGSEDEMATCPVMGDTMRESEMVAYSYKDKTYYFCDTHCAMLFKADPEKYIEHPAKPLPPA